MKTTLQTHWTIADIVSGFQYDENACKGLYGLDGQLTIQPEYQRNYLYASKGKEPGVISTVLQGLPLGLFYFVKTDDGRFEVLDGQQRITSLGRFATGKFSRDGLYFRNLDADQQAGFMAYPLLIYVCEGTKAEINSWFKTINTAGIRLEDQEVLNALYSGPYVTAARNALSNPNSAKADFRANFIGGSVAQQKHLEAALSWLSGGKDQIENHLKAHRSDPNADELIRHCDVVCEWAQNLFGTADDMKRVDWGRLYRDHQNTPPTAALKERLSQLRADPYVTNKAGIYEYLLRGESDEAAQQLLNVRYFHPSVVESQYSIQTREAKAAGLSNCPYCAANGSDKLYGAKQMEADHIRAWSKGGKSDGANCQMLCKAHNLRKSDA